MFKICILKAQSSTLYIYYIYIELASTQSPFFQNLPYECTKCKQKIEFWQSAHIVRALLQCLANRTREILRGSLIKTMGVIEIGAISKYVISRHFPLLHKFPPRVIIRFLLGVSYVTANLYCICLSEHETCPYVDAVQLCGNIWNA